MQTNQKMAKKAKKVAKKVKKSPKKAVMAKITRTSNLSKVPKAYYGLSFKEQNVNYSKAIEVLKHDNIKNLPVSELNKMTNCYLTKGEANEARKLVWSTLRG